MDILRSIWHAGRVVHLGNEIVIQMPTAVLMERGPQLVPSAVIHRARAGLRLVRRGRCRLMVWLGGGLLQRPLIAGGLRGLVRRGLEGWRGLAGSRLPARRPYWGWRALTP